MSVSEKIYIEINDNKYRANLLLPKLMLNIITRGCSSGKLQILYHGNKLYGAIRDNVVHYIFELFPSALEDVSQTCIHYNHRKNTKFTRKFKPRYMSNSKNTRLLTDNWKHIHDLTTHGIYNEDAGITITDYPEMVIFHLPPRAEKKIFTHLSDKYKILFRDIAKSTHMEVPIVWVALLFLVAYVLLSTA